MNKYIKTLHKDELNPNHMVHFGILALPDVNEVYLFKDILQTFKRSRFGFKTKLLVKRTNFNFDTRLIPIVELGLADFNNKMVNKLAVMVEDLRKSLYDVYKDDEKLREVHLEHIAGEYKEYLEFLKEPDFTKTFKEIAGVSNSIFLGNVTSHYDGVAYYGISLGDEEEAPQIIQALRYSNLPNREKSERVVLEVEKLIMSPSEFKALKDYFTNLKG